MRLDHSAAATSLLLDDLRSDQGMGWVPKSGWLTKIAVDAGAPQLSYDLAIDASGAGVPSWVQAGFDAPPPIVDRERHLDARTSWPASSPSASLLIVVAVSRPAAATARLTPQG